jgi:beta-glucosidase/6-phospho-beta-glucosidase/beta-galactosidase
MTSDEYRWLMNNHRKNRCVMGNDYYATNESIVHGDGSVSPSGEIFGYYPITHQYFARYSLPVMHTETNNLGGVNAVAWLQKEWANVHRLKKDGVPLIGFTWYSLQDQVDWDTALRENNGRVNPLGLCDLDRNIRPVGRAYQKLIADWRQILPTESSVLGICE